MSLAIRRTLGLALVVTLGAAIAIFEPHRQLLSVAWPVIESFWFTYIAF